MFHPVNRKKLIQKLEKHPRPENLNSLKIKKIWSESKIKISKIKIKIKIKNK